MPPQPSDLPLSPQFAGIDGVHVQVPATVMLEPVQVLFANPPPVVQLQVRFMPPGPSWNALSGPVEQALPTWPVAMYVAHVASGTHVPGPAELEQ